MTRTLPMPSILVIVLASICLPCSSPLADGDVDEEAAIRAAVEGKYIAGLRTRDFGLIEEICHPETKLMGARDSGELHVTTLERWSQKFDPEAPPFSQLDFAVSRIDRVGTVAQVRIDFTVDSTRHVTDFLHMVKVEGEWRIVNIIDY